MRVISQDGTIDVPYEYVALVVSGGKYKDSEYACIYCHNISTPHGTRLAEYSSKEKAIKAMEILREQYSRIEIIKALASGTCKHMEESLKPEEFKDILKKYINMEVFQFPQDDEIEV